MDMTLAQMDFATARALYEWQVELGADEAVGDLPVNRYEQEQPAVKASRSAPGAPNPAPQPAAADPVEAAAAAAARAASLEQLATAQSAYDLCDLKKGARNFVFADGNPEARVMIIGEAPGRDEDIEGRPFVGRAGQLLDRMFAAIGLARTAHHPVEAIYITNVMPWRPPQNRDPEPAEIAMMLPFLKRHVELVNPKLVILMGNTPCAAALGQRGILRLRGNWTAAFGKPALPMTHPAYLLRNPAAKREAWADLLEIKARLEDPA
ncbi:uracil-DNA glycosylase [Defluviimonas sp. WL0002]|uniref:Type-4 uracil-DNA glycosylase n=1 Tax=Albidovulum marisflavi TaxID=2984159 RepID=A0ABT2Z7X1_9RHOB|nr:uracil-DNA glycosylase [Defluviimonas sp. WL0002]MCV2867183.1 uracil-DNA glycosylase [Defluviimonas sp. WL0002]